MPQVAPMFWLGLYLILLSTLFLLSIFLFFLSKKGSYLMEMEFKYKDLYWW